MQPSDEQTTTMAIFSDHTIRQIWHDDEWFFSVVDVIAALTESTDPRQYWPRLKARVKNDSGFELSTLCTQLKLPASDGKLRETDCANTKNMLHIVQYVPSKKAIPFREWLAQVGAERLAEHKDLKGYPVIRKGKQLTHNGDLRSGMTALELAVITLAENVSTGLHIQRDSQGFTEVARDVGDAANLAKENRLKLEEMTGQPVVSATNMLVERDGGLWSLLPPPEDA